MKMKLIKWLLAGGCGLLAACAIITVNVYFPEKAAKEAYKSLDDMLLKNKAETLPEGEKLPVEEQKPIETKPLSSLIKTLPSLSLLAEAQAAESDADALAVELAGMPEVTKAYEEMSQRLPRLITLFNSGAIGLTNQGLLAVRDKAKMHAPDEELVNAENKNRKVIITSMAKAIIKLNKQQVTQDALDQVLGKAAASYAEIKRDAAKSGWWIQLQNNRWIQK